MKDIMRTFKIHNTYQRALICTLMLLLLAYITFFSVEKTGGSEYIWIEAEDATKIENNFEIKTDNNSSGKLAVFATSESHIINSFIQFDFKTKSRNAYDVWVRIYGEDACGNSCHFSTSNSKRFVIGNDDIMRIWHWVKVPGKFKFNPGKNSAYIWNEDFGTGIDKILLTTDYSFEPSGDGESSNLNFDFSDGIPEALHIDNNWEIKELINKKALFPKFIDKGNMILFNKEMKNDFILEIETFHYNNPSFEILFNVKDQDNFSALQCKNNVIYFAEKSTKGYLLLDSLEFNEPDVISDETNKWSFIIKDTGSRLNLNDKTIYKNGSSVFKLNTKTGIILHKNTGLVKLVQKLLVLPNINSTFFNGMVGDWENISGKWILGEAPYYCVYSKEHNKNSYLVRGEYYFQNIYLSTTIKGDNGKAGLIFNYQDTLNYMFFGRSDASDNFSLYKKYKGRKTLIQKVNCKVKNNQWNNFAVLTKNGNITCYINEKKIIEDYDYSLEMGKVGITTLIKSGDIMFDDFIVTGAASIKEIQNNTYEFSNRLDFSRDLAKWENAESFFKFEQDKILMTKALFERKTLSTKDFISPPVTVNYYSTDIAQDIDIIIGFETGTKDKYEYIISPGYIQFCSNGNYTSRVNIKREKDYSMIIEQDRIYLGKKGEILDSINIQQINSCKIYFGYEGVGVINTDHIPTIQLIYE